MVKLLGLAGSDATRSNGKRGRHDAGTAATALYAAAMKLAPRAMKSSGGIRAADPDGIGAAARPCPVDTRRNRRPALLAIWRLGFTARYGTSIFRKIDALSAIPLFPSPMRVSS